MQMNINTYVYMYIYVAQRFMIYVGRRWIYVMEMRPSSSVSIGLAAVSANNGAHIHQEAHVLCVFKFGFKEFELNE